MMGDGDIEQVDPLDLDLLTASLRADAGDNATFFEVLASKLADALGERLSVERDGGLLRRGRAVRSLSVDLDGSILTISRERGRLSCLARRSVRGVVLSTEELGFDEWLARLARGLAEEAKRSATTRAALQALLA